MLVEFSVIPIGIGSSLGAQLAEVLKIVDASGLPYKLNPMGTVGCRWPGLALRTQTWLF